MKKILVLLLAILTIQNWTYAQTTAFPGAEGGGMYTTGGRGGKVYYVNTLVDNSSGNSATREGSLRWCLNQASPKIIMFKVSGTIVLKSNIKISKGDVTIAGQSAPGDGICLKDYNMTVGADNVIIRYMRFRMGDEKVSEDDALWGRYNKNIVIDHCSMSWSTDECASFYSNENMTMQWCFITESLNNSVHEKGEHGYGAIWGGKNVTFHHNLLAHHNSRNPRFNGWKRDGLGYVTTVDEERLDYRNNVVYNWGDNSAYGGESAGKYNIVGNYYKYGEGTKSSIKTRIVNIDMDKDPSKCLPGYGTFYITDNYVYGSSAVTNSNWGGVSYASGVDKTASKATVPFEAYPITEHSAETAFSKVLKLGGASYSRDAVDERIANEVKTGSYTFVGGKTSKKGIIDSQTDLKPVGAGDDWTAWPTLVQGTVPADSDRDGIPDGWLDENYPGKTANDKNAEGYTYLEVYLNSLVKHITDEQLDGGGVIIPPDEITIFCDAVPTDGVISDDLKALVSAGIISTAGNRSDGCTENGYVWRVGDVTFTLPAKSKFSVNFTSNGGRKIYVTINGDEANKELYSIGATSCIPVYYEFDETTANTIRIESFNSGGDTSMQFSMTELCIKEIKEGTSVGSSVTDENRIYVTREGVLYSDITADIQIYSVSGKLVKSARNTDQLNVSDLMNGVYIARLINVSGDLSIHKFIVR